MKVFIKMCGTIESDYFDTGIYKTKYLFPKLHSLSPKPNARILIINTNYPTSTHPTLRTNSTQYPLSQRL